MSLAKYLDSDYSLIHRESVDWLKQRYGTFDAKTVSTQGKNKEHKM